MIQVPPAATVLSKLLSVTLTTSLDALADKRSKQLTKLTTRTDRAEVLKGELPSRAAQPVLGIITENPS